MSVCAGLAAGLFPSSAALAQPTAFTYQGQLRDGVAPANGSYDLILQAFKDATGGNPVGPPQCINDHAVTEGLFTAKVELGEFHNGAPYYLEVRVRRHAPGVDCSDTSGFTTLSPRQEITPAPLANYARVASSLASPDGDPQAVVIVDDAGRVGIGTDTPSSQLELVGTQDSLRISAFRPFMTFRDTAANNARSLIQGADGGIFTIGENFMNGTNGTAFTWMDPSGNLAIGHYTPTAKLDVNGNVHASGMFTAGARVQRYKTIHGAAFQPETESGNSTPVTIRYPDGIVGTTPGNSCAENYYYATLDLPDGAVITNVLFTYYDNGPCSIRGQLYRLNIFNGQINQMVNFPAEDANGLTVKVVGTSNIWLPTVDNSAYAYVLRVSMNGFSRTSGAYMSIVGARITYETNIMYP